jgi:hypothetical protein
MLSMLSQSRVEFAPERGEPSEDVRLCVVDLLASCFAPPKLSERRRDHRYPFTRLIQVTPVETSGLPSGETIVAAGRSLSEHGLSFYHPQPLACRRAIVTVERCEGVFARLLVDLSWCRFTRQGWYESGGRFLQVVDSP